MRGRVHPFRNELSRESIRVIRSFLRDSDIRSRGIRLARAKFFQHGERTRLCPRLCAVGEPLNALATL
jgi:hypothetical protein